MWPKNPTLISSEENTMMLVMLLIGFGLGFGFHDKLMQKFNDLKAKYWK